MEVMFLRIEMKVWFVREVYFDSKIVIGKDKFFSRASEVDKTVLKKYWRRITDIDDRFFSRLGFRCRNQREQNIRRRGRFVDLLGQTRRRGPSI